MDKKMMEQKDNNVLYSDAIRSAKKESDFDFAKWFDGGNDLVDIKYSGYNNVILHILTPKVIKLIKNFDNCLEIGVGGGRLANASSKFFKKFYGIDVHDSLDKTKTWLEFEGNVSFELTQVNECKIPYKDNKFDFIYTFIVLQHVLHKECIDSYVEEIYRTLRNDGVAVIYVGRPRFLYRFIRSNFAIFVDSIIEKILSLFGKNIYQYKNAKVNHVNIEVSNKYMTSKLNKLGFKIVDKMYSYKKYNQKDFGGQTAYLVTK